MTFRSASHSSRSPRRAARTALTVALLCGCASSALAQVPRPNPQVKVILDQARAARTARKTDTAFDLYTQAQSQAKDLEDDAGQAAAFAGLGNLYSDQGQNDKALTAYEQAVRLYKSIGDSSNAAVTELNRGRLYAKTGQQARALEAFQQALPVFQDTEDKANLAATLNGLGALYLMQEQFGPARQAYQQAVPLQREVGSKPGEAAAMSGLGETYRRAGQAEQAIPFYQKALPLFRASGDKANEAMLLSNLGAAYVSAGAASQGAEFYQQAQSLYAASGDTSGQAQALSSQADAYLSVGQNAKALTALQQAATVFQTAKDLPGETNAYVRIGEAYRQLNQPVDALKAYQKAQDTAHRGGNPAGEALALSGMGKVYFGTDQYAKAVKPYEQALALYRAAGDPSSEAVTLTNLGNAYLNLNQPTKALPYYRKALPVYQALANRVGAAHVLSRVAEAELGAGQDARALADYAQAVALLEQVRTDLTTDTAALDASDRDIYTAYLQLLLEKRKLPEAFAMAQKAKAFTLATLTASALPNVDAARMTPNEIEERQGLRDQALALDAQTGGSMVAAQRAALTTKRRGITAKVQTLNAALYARHPDLSDRHQAKTATLADTARFLPADTALLEYVQTAPDLLSVFVVTRGAAGNPQVNTFDIPLTDSLRQQCAGFRAACLDPRKPYQPLARQLYPRLVAPAQQWLSGKQRLIVCPDGVLWDVPFQALLAPGDRFVNQTWEVNYALSATSVQNALSTQQRRKARPAPASPLLIVVNPTLGSADRLGELNTVTGAPAGDALSRQAMAVMTRSGQMTPLVNAQKEADAVKGAFPNATVLTGDAAQEAAFTQAAGTYRYIHVASYGVLSDTAPLASSLILASPVPKDGNQDGFLTARELSALSLDAELVTLSACGVGRSPTAPGASLTGTAWALQTSGVPTQIVSRWVTDTPTTAPLMGRFYTALKSRSGKGDALRRTTLSVAQDKATRHPYYWSSFVLMGDWR